jgi:DNA replication protein DnaC
MITSLEAKEKGYPTAESIPKPLKCKFCNKPLYHRGLISPKNKMVWKWIPPERCSCDKAQEYWRRYDQEQERIMIETVKEEEREKFKKRIQRLLGESGIKKRFLNRTFENFKVDKVNSNAYKVAKTYAEDFENYKKNGEGLYFVGSFGTGKTHLAVAISIHLINKGVPVICKTLIDLLADIKKTFDSNHINEHEILNIYKTVDLLVIDDLGKELPTDWAMAALYSILNDRYENCLPTIITTNYNDKELIERLSRKSDTKTAGAIVDRLHEVCFPVEMNWQSKRTAY